MIPRLEPLGREVARTAHLLHQGVVVLAAGRHTVDDDVADLAHQPVPFRLGLSRLPLQLLHPGRGVLDLRQQVRLLLPGRRGHLAPHGLLLGAQAFELRKRGAVVAVRHQRGVDEALVLSTGALGGAHPLRFLTKQP